MGSTNTTSVDRNRLGRTYPSVRRSPKNVVISTNSLIAETGEVTFTDATSGTYTFRETYTSAPNVTITPVDSSGGLTANVGVHITSVTTSAVAIQSTAPFTGTVHVQVMSIG